MTHIEKEKARRAAVEAEGLKKDRIGHAENYVRLVRESAKKTGRAVPPALENALILLASLPADWFRSDEKTPDMLMRASKN